MAAYSINVSGTVDKTKKATLITKGGFGNIVVKHVYLIDHGTRKWAQYNNAPFVQYLEKGKRKPHGFVAGYAPYILILEGWQDIQSQSLFGAPKQSNGFAISESRFSSFSDGWVKEFETSNKIENIIADYRNINTY